MRVARVLTILSIVAASPLGSAFGCGTSAVGIDDCRRIETARCNAAVYCPDVFGSIDAKACSRFYRDQCLHGLLISDSPGRPAVTRCVDAIDKLGRCVRDNGTSASVGDCGASTLDQNVQGVCDLVAKPELIPDCAFLQPPEDAAGGSAGAAGEAGEAGQAGG